MIQWTALLYFLACALALHPLCGRCSCTGTATVQLLLCCVVVAAIPGRGQVAYWKSACQTCLTSQGSLFTTPHASHRLYLSASSAPSRRTALLRQALRAELEAPARPKDTPGPMRTKDPGVDPNRVTSGRLLTCLAALQSGLARQGAAENQARIARLESIRLALLRLLEDVQAGRGSPAASAGSAAAAGAARS